MLHFSLLVVLFIFWEAAAMGQSFPKSVTVGNNSKYTTIGAAILACPNNSKSTFYIKIEEGVYRENIRIGKEKGRVTLIGAGIKKTVIIGNRSNGTGFSTYDSATIGIKCKLFVAIDISFENDAGPKNRQAVALLSETDSAFYRCSFEGYQDTLYAKKGMQFYRECTISGTIDFIFGNARVIFQNSSIIVKKPLPTQFNTITAQKREPADKAGGTVFQYCKVTGSTDLGRDFKTYLGRPWGRYSRVVFIETYMSEIVSREGWIAWDNKTDGSKVYYAEYRNKGPGSDTKGRAKWSGVKILRKLTEVDQFSVIKFIDGDKWIPSGIPFIPDLH